jgi:hypothetical protein
MGKKTGFGLASGLLVVLAVALLAAQDRPLGQPGSGEPAAEHLPPSA